MDSAEALDRQTHGSRVYESPSFLLSLKQMWHGLFGHPRNSVSINDDNRAHGGYLWAWCESCHSKFTLTGEKP